ncbi:MAG: carboxypeptidase-like regulatory domain-containing protein [Fimbriimonadaceae bacterium]|nr:carboxypeptidase-like regulatory domain-containing protein [Fimbriimonadaceae bacterium]
MKNPLSLRIFGTLALLALTALWGCGGSGSGGGGGGARTATIAGTVSDINGNPVRGAKVSTRDGSTVTSTSGAYWLDRQRADNLDVKAEIVQNGVRYRGQNVAVTLQDLPTQSVNIVVAPENQLASIRGVVEDRDGARLAGASVFAYDTGILSSQRTVTNANGEYELFGLVSGLNYTVVAGGREYRSDVDQVLLSDGERQTVNFTLGTPGNPQMEPPQNLSVTSWTSPRAAARAARDRDVLDNMKRIFDKPKATRKRMSASRLSTRGNFIEVDLEFDPIDSLELLGYGIYRARGNGPFTAIDFLREPLAGYYVDLDEFLRPDSDYTYAVTSLSVMYPDFPAQSESDFSNEATVLTLDDLVGIGVNQDPVEFFWDGGSGAETYVVYLFDQFPGIGVESIWNNEENPVAGNNLAYSGPNLDFGRRYYYLVLGLADNNAARTLSAVGEFIAE